jgi:hypothetical protein
MRTFDGSLALPYQGACADTVANQGYEIELSPCCTRYINSILAVIYDDDIKNLFKKKLLVLSTV